MVSSGCLRDQSGHVHTQSWRRVSTFTHQLGVVLHTHMHATTLVAPTIPGLPYYKHCTGQSLASSSPLLRMHVQVTDLVDRYWYVPDVHFDCAVDGIPVDTLRFFWSREKQNETPHSMGYTSVEV